VSFTKKFAGSWILFRMHRKSKGNDKCEGRVCNYSWSGQRKTPSYLNKLVFPEKFLTALRTIALQEDELFQVQSMLEEVQFL